MQPAFYNFGPFQVDVARRLLLQDGQPAQLSPKVFDTLLELIARARQVITKEELLVAVWPDAVVEENSLARNISTLRKALGESASDHQYVITVPGRGYSFVAEVHRIEHPQEPRLDQPAAGSVRTPGRRFSKTVAFGVLLAAGAAAAVFSFSYRKSDAAPFQRTKTARMTSSGQAVKAVISPDGRYIAYTTLVSGNQSLVVKRTTTLHDLEIVPPAPVRYAGITFSPDSETVYYVIWKPGPEASVLYRVPVMGGSSQKLKANLDSPVTLSPDGKSVAFVRESSNQSTIVMSNLDSGAERKLMSRNLPQVLDYPAWSPDGRTIACSTYVAGSTGGDARLIEVDVAEGRERPVSAQFWGFIRQIAWFNDRRGLIMSARSPESAVYHLWLVSYPGGAVRKLTDGVNYQTGASISADSRRIVTVEEHRFSAIARIDSKAALVWRRLWKKQRDHKAGRLLGPPMCQPSTSQNPMLRFLSARFSLDSSEFA
jgi:DNA-binding winged helix-turn-helix (wHTH) protein